MNPKTLGIAGAVGTVALVSFGALFSTIVGSGLGSERKLRFAMELLDEGKWDVAGRLARDLVDSGAVTAEENSGFQYAIGVSQLQSVAEDFDTPATREVLVAATKALEKSAELGFPLGYHGKGNFYLGTCYFHTYRWEDAIERLSTTPSEWPQRRTDAYELIVRAHLSQRPPELEPARDTLAKWKAIPGTSPSEKARMKLAGSELAFSAGRTDECEQLLTSISENLPEHLESELRRGKWRLEEFERANLIDPTASLWMRNQGSSATTFKLLTEGEAIFRRLVTKIGVTPDVQRKTSYLLGRTLRHQARTDEALSVLSGLRQRNPSSAEGIAAGLEEAEILLEKDDMQAVVQTTDLLLGNLGDLELYNATWMPLSVLRTRLVDLGSEVQKSGDYPRAIAFSKNLHKAFGPSYSERLQAETYSSWGALLASRDVEDVGEREQLQRSIMSKYRKAGEAYTRLAEMELRSPDYTGILWDAAESYRKASDLDRANELLGKYLQYSKRTERPQGLLALANNYLAEAKWRKALKPLSRCLTDYLTSPISYEARLLTARAHKELNELDEAIELLEKNLWDYSLHPSSRTWQNSLFTLGQAHYDRADQVWLDVRLQPDLEWSDKEPLLRTMHNDFMIAAERLAEATARYPDDRRAIAAEYQIAQAYRLASRLPGETLTSNAALVESSRRQLNQQKRKLLTKALEQYRRLRSEAGGATNPEAFEKTMAIPSRNAYFGEADTLYDLGQWEEAILAYRNAASRFMMRPESLEALVQIADCHRKLGRESDARKILGQAEQVLKRIPAEQNPNFVAFTRSNREGWKDRLNWLKSFN